MFSTTRQPAASDAADAVARMLLRILDILTCSRSRDSRSDENGARTCACSAAFSAPADVARELLPLFTKATDADDAMCTVSCAFEMCGAWFEFDATPKRPQLQLQCSASMEAMGACNRTTVHCNLPDKPP